MDFLNRNAGAVQAVAAMLTVVLALAALIGVKVQIDATEKIQQAQSARDIYREYLNLAINKPEFARPDYCKIVGTSLEPGYENFVEYLLYTAEQTISVDVEWTSTFLDAMKDHGQYLCRIDAGAGYSASVVHLIEAFQDGSCKTIPPCT